MLSVTHRGQSSAEPLVAAHSGFCGSDEMNLRCVYLSDTLTNSKSINNSGACVLPLSGINL